MLKQTYNWGLQVCLSIYDLLLTSGTTDLSKKEIRKQLSDQNCKS